MSEHFRDPIKRSDHFHQVLALHREPELKWDLVSQMAPLLPRGWYELSRLPPEDRIEFTREFWLSKIPILNPAESHLEDRLYSFFDSLEEIEIFVTQERPQQPFEAHMVYGLKEASGFFHGNPPAKLSAIDALKRQYAHVDLPTDYLAFLLIHDGFSKYTDTGIFKSRDMTRIFQHLQQLLSEDILVRPDGQLIDPPSLIPFYESKELHAYQCFYADWRPGGSVGNIYFSQADHTISNFLDSLHGEENLAFETFLGWLVYYLEDFEPIDGIS